MSEKILGNNPEDFELFGGLSGINLPINEFEIGEGIVISQTYAHIMAPYLAAFSRPKSGQHHPGPLKAVSGGMAFDINTQIFLPSSFKINGWFDRINTIWWILALLRLRGAVVASIPVVSNMAFSDITEGKDEPLFWPIEMQEKKLIPEIPSNTNIEIDDLEWIQKYWKKAGFLMASNNSFNHAFQAFDSCRWCSTDDLATISLWGALERIFSDNNAELKFRASCFIASYLVSKGEDRISLFKSLSKLYCARSKAAHGNNPGNPQAFRDTYFILQRVLIKIIENNIVPNMTDLENLLFGI